MPADPVDEAAGRLYGLPLEEFIPERNARAKALRKEGDKEAAAEVAKLPKPGQVAWIANQLSRAGEADELLEAGQALREAQLGGGGRDALREATAAERGAVEDLVKRAQDLRKLSRDATDRLRTLLHALAADEQLRESSRPAASSPSPSRAAPGRWERSSPPRAGAGRRRSRRRAESRRRSAANARPPSARPPNAPSGRRSAPARRLSAASSSAA